MSKLTLGGRQGWPDGWEHPIPRVVLSKNYPFIIKFPTVWAKRRPATQQDIDAIVEYKTSKFGFTKPYYDEGTTVGKRSKLYKTAHQKLKENVLAKRK